jgi:hypothetical protein
MEREHINHVFGNKSTLSLSLTHSLTHSLSLSLVEWFEWFEWFDSWVLSSLTIVFAQTHRYVSSFWHPFLYYMYDSERIWILLSIEFSIAAFCWGFHFVKRIVETHFVHTFSRDTMGLYFLIRNCVYYWIFGIYIGYYVNHPLYTPVQSVKQFWGGFVAFFVRESHLFTLFLFL